MLSINKLGKLTVIACLTLSIVGIEGGTSDERQNEGGETIKKRKDESANEGRKRKDESANEGRKRKDESANEGRKRKDESVHEGRKRKDESVHEGRKRKDESVHEGVTLKGSKGEGGKKVKSKSDDQTTGEDKTKAREPIKDQIKTLKVELKQEGNEAAKLLKGANTEKSNETTQPTTNKTDNESFHHHVTRFFIQPSRKDKKA